MTLAYNSTPESSTETKEEKALEQVTKFLKQSEEYCKPYFDKFSKIFADYIVARGAKRPFQRADLKPPYSFTIIESFVPELVESFFSDKPYVNVFSQNPNFYPFERPLEDFLSYQFDEMRIIPKFSVFAKNLLLYGTAIVKTPWKNDSKLLNTAQGISSQVNYDMPDWENVPIWDFFPDPTVSQPADIESGSGCIHRVWRTYEELKRKEKKTLSTGETIGIYTNLEDLKIFLDEDKDSNKGTATTLQEYQEKYTTSDPDIKRKDKVEVLEYWGCFYPDDTGEPLEYVITIVERKHVIRCDPNPLQGVYRPFLGAVDYPVPNDFYGLGEIEPSWSLIRESSALRNARLDAVNLTINPMMIVDRTAGFNVRNLYTRPNGILLGNDINGIKEFGFSDKVLSAFREISDLDQNITKTVGLTPSGVEGAVTSNFARTSTGVQYLNRTINSRITLKVRLIADAILNPFARRVLNQTHQFGGQDVFFRNTGDQNNPFPQIPIQAFNHNYILNITSAMDRLSKKDRQANMKENVIPLLQMYAQMNPFGMNWDLFVSDTLKDFDYREAAKYINPPQQQQQMQQANQQQQMMMAEHNAMAQAQAQAQIVGLQGQIDTNIKDQANKTALTRDVVKGVISNEQAQTTHEETRATTIGNTLLKEISADAREQSKPQPTNRPK